MAPAWSGRNNGLSRSEGREVRAATSSDTSTPATSASLGCEHDSDRRFIDDWIEQILEDVCSWYRLYGDQLTGIFFDQVAESDDGLSIASVLRRLRDHVRALAPGAITVLNPGVAVPPAFAGLADVLVTFEGPCADYLAEDLGFERLSWRPGAEQKIWHIVHHTPDPVRAARGRRAQPASRRRI